MSASNWMIYGAYGYTGTLLAEEAVRRGHRPILAGRSATKLKPLAERLGLEWNAVALDNTAALHEAVRGVSAVMHAAGPYSRTCAPMLNACLAGITNYLDVTGEIKVFEHVFEHDQQAWDREIALIPGVGYDVVPSDCLVNYVAGKITDPAHLEIGVYARGGASPGTVKTALDGQLSSGYIRRSGTLQPHPFGKGAKKIDFPIGARMAMPIPWGDLATAYRSTGIPNITTYMAFPPGIIRLSRWTAPVFKLLKAGFIREVAMRLVEASITGPDAAARESGRSYFWAQVSNNEGQSTEAWMSAVEGYTLTARAGIRAVERVLAERPRGAFTPAQAFGADFALEIEGTTRQDSL
jgi:short subunit dehydrogenase-like uncharacterized protein